ncbi:MAG TPA: exosortase/archaeosortase family protein [Opitutaceae bacterium]|nr:exosortase/archaeosortase family protein [Opitutaceae bacterium]
MAAADPVSFRAISSWQQACVLMLGLLAAGLTVLLWPQWQHNPDLSHGLFMPVVFVLLVYEARTSGPRRYLKNGLRLRLALGAALLLGLVALAMGGLYALALGWSHALVGFMLATALSLFALATLLGSADDAVRLVPFGWTSLLAAGLWILSAPIPPGAYTRLTIALQLLVSTNVVHTLHFLGIAATRHGNLIELAHSTVGIEEACSGVRSLVSCVFAGFFFSGCLVRRPGPRAALILLAAPLALTMNFIRSLTLTLLANSGVDISGRWHDLTGFAVLGVTAILLGGLALLLERREKGATSRAAAVTGTAPAVPGRHPALAAGLGLAVLLVAFLSLRTVLAPVPPRPPLPDLDAILPQAVPGWQVITSNDLNRFKDALQTDHFIQRTYFRASPDGAGLQITVYIAYWAPGQASVSLVATHTPDACWPGTGWDPVPVTPTRQSLVTGGRPLAEAEHRLFRSNGFPQHVWFWHMYDHEPVPYLDPLSPRNLLNIALHYGFRRAGDQMFVRFSSNHPWPEIADEPVVREIFAQLQPLGL